MWPFGKKTDEEPLRDKVRELEKAYGRLELEWNSWYDKFRTLYARIAKRAERLEKAEETEPQSTQDAPETTNRLHVGYGHPPLPRRSLRGF